MKRKFLIAAVIIVVALTGGAFVFSEWPKPASTTVARVIDGDTIEMSDGTRVRYIGIDAPEAGECFAAEATAYNRELVEGKVVRLVPDVSDRDGYGRLLRYVYVSDSGTYVNLALVQSGHARAIYITPDVSEYPKFRAGQDGARAEGLGLWSACY